MSAFTFREMISRNMNKDRKNERKKTGLEYKRSVRPIGTQSTWSCAQFTFNAVDERTTRRRRTKGGFVALLLLPFHAVGEIDGDVLALALGVANDQESSEHGLNLTLALVVFLDVTLENFALARETLLLALDLVARELEIDDVVLKSSDGPLAVEVVAVVVGKHGCWSI